MSCIAANNAPISNAKSDRRSIAKVKWMRHGSRKAGLARAFKLAQKAEKGWRKLNGSQKLQDLTDRIVFIDGERKAA